MAQRLPSLFHARRSWIVVICSHLLRVHGSLQRSVAVFRLPSVHVRPGPYRVLPNEGGSEMTDAMTDAMTTPHAHTTPWAEVLTLGDTRFGVPAGGPFAGRCSPLPTAARRPFSTCRGSAPARRPRYGMSFATACTATAPHNVLRRSPDQAGER